MCIDAPEFTTNCLSSGFFEDGVGIAQTSVGEKNAALSLSQQTFFRQVPCFCGRVVLVATFPLVSYPQILAHKDCVLEVRTFE